MIQPVKYTGDEAAEYSTIIQTPTGTKAVMGEVLYLHICINIWPVVLKMYVTDDLMDIYTSLDEKV